MSTLEEQATELFQFRNNLFAIGCTDEMTAEVIRKYGAHIPVFSTQLDGVYIRPDGRRDRHHAIPGWYSILSVEGSTMQIRKPYLENADVFECGTFWVPMVVGANMEMIDKGHPSPDKTFEPTAFCEACQTGMLAGIIPGTLSNGERCDTCERYACDIDAAAAIAKATGGTH